jgi:hypothetical protein
MVARGSCRNRHFGGTYRIYHQGEKGQRARNNVSNKCKMASHDPCMHYVIKVAGSNAAKKECGSKTMDSVKLGEGRGWIIFWEGRSFERILRLVAFPILTGIYCLYLLLRGYIPVRHLSLRQLCLSNRLLIVSQSSHACRSVHPSVRMKQSSSEIRSCIFWLPVICIHVKMYHQTESCLNLTKRKM